jgi:hypothetical protein
LHYAFHPPKDYQKLNLISRLSGWAQYVLNREHSVTMSLL